MTTLTDAAKRQLDETVRQYQLMHADDLPKCDDAYERLYPDQVTLFVFRESWQRVARQLAHEAEQLAAREALRAEILAEIDGGSSEDAGVSDGATAQEPSAEPEGDPPADDAEPAGDAPADGDTADPVDDEA